MFKYNVDAIKDIKRALRRKKEICEKYFNSEINSLTDFYQIGLYVGAMKDIVNSYYVANMINTKQQRMFNDWIDKVDSYYFTLIQNSFHKGYLVTKD